MSRKPIRVIQAGVPGTQGSIGRQHVRLMEPPGKRKMEPFQHRSGSVFKDSYPNFHPLPAKFFKLVFMLSTNFFPFPEITTERLLLRELAISDAPAVRHLRSNLEVMKYINRPLTLTVEDAEKWIGVILEALQKGDGITWCLCLKEAPLEHLGTIGLWRIEKENYRAEIGYMLEPSLQRKGIMYEAICKVVDYGFGEMKLHSIEGRIDPRNLASATVLQKAGFVQEAHFKENYFVGSGFADTAVYSILTPYADTADRGEVPAKTIV